MEPNEYKKKDEKELQSKQMHEQAAAEQRLRMKQEADQEWAKDDRDVEQEDFGFENDVTAAARDDDEGSHEPGQSRGSMSSDRGLRATHTQKRTSVSEQEEIRSRRPAKKHEK